MRGVRAVLAAVQGAALPLVAWSQIRPHFESDRDANQTFREGLAGGWIVGVLTKQDRLEYYVDVDYLRGVTSYGQ